MRTLMLGISALAALVALGPSAQRAEAAPLANPAGIAAAMDDLSLVDTVHCRPGRPHHFPAHWRRADGCPRLGRVGVVIETGRPHFVMRHGVRVRVGSNSSIRSSVRTQSTTTVRERSGL